MSIEPAPTLYKPMLQGQSGLVVEVTKLTISCPKCSVALDVTGHGIGNHATCHCGNVTYIPQVKLGKAKAAATLVAGIVIGVLGNAAYDLIKHRMLAEDPQVELTAEPQKNSLPGAKK